eukprot:gene21063-biopygen29798
MQKHQGYLVSHKDKADGLDPDLKVMVLAIDNDRQRISLGTKSLEGNPGAILENPQLVYANAEEKAATFRAGVLKAEARKRIKAELRAEAEARKRIKAELRAEAEARKQERMKASGVVDPNLKVMVLAIDNDRQRISLGTKSLEGNPGAMLENPQLVYEKAEEAAATFRAGVLEADPREQERMKASGVVDPNLKVHELRSGLVRSVQTYGVFVDIGAGPSGLLHISQISSDWTSEECLQTLFSVGDKIKVMVLAIDTDLQHISLGTKSLEFIPGAMLENPQLVYEKAEGTAATFRAGVPEADPREQERMKASGVVDPNLKVHELRSGVVQDIQGGSVWVHIGAGVIGMLQKTQISTKRVTLECLKKMFSVGDVIKVMIHKIDTDRQHIFLSTKSLEKKPGDMVKNPQLVYEKAEETAAAFRAKVEV